MKNDNKSCGEDCLATETHILSNGMELRRRRDRQAGSFVLISERSVLVPHEQWDEVTSRTR
jgi:hypothetical protein